MDPRWCNHLVHLVQDLLPDQYKKLRLGRDFDSMLQHQCDHPYHESLGISYCCLLGLLLEPVCFPLLSNEVFC